MNCREIWVYTGAEDHIARNFYVSLDFEVIGQAKDWALDRTMDNSDVVLRRMVAEV
jgi:hypothetical protein